VPQTSAGSKPWHRRRRRGCGACSVCAGR